MKYIGGYHELELRKGIVYHKDCIALNTGRTALELILRTKTYSKIFMPFYTCDAILEPLRKLDMTFDFYHINEDLEPIFNFNQLKPSDAFLYINYFGLKEFYIHKLSDYSDNLIIDNSQAFFSKPYSKALTFYSCRKFFGVPDGAFLCGLNESHFEDYPIDYSADRLKHLLYRIEKGPKKGYNYFQENELVLKKQPIKRMSLLTSVLLSNIDYDKIKKIREENFVVLHEKLSYLNELKIDLSCLNGPLCYPFLVKNGYKLREKLIDNNIFIPKYWSNVNDLTNIDTYEFYLSENLLPLPIDQRYNENDMNQIIQKILL